MSCETRRAGSCRSGRPCQARSELRTMPDDALTLWAGAAAGASVPLLYLTWTPLVWPLTLLGLLVGAGVARWSRAPLGALRASTPVKQGFLQGAVAGSLAGLSSWSVFSLIYWMVRLCGGQ